MRARTSPQDPRNNKQPKRMTPITVCTVFIDRNRQTLINACRVCHVGYAAARSRAVPKPGYISRPRSLAEPSSLVRFFVKLDRSVLIDLEVEAAVIRSSERPHDKRQPIMYKEGAEPPDPSVFRDGGLHGTSCSARYLTGVVKARQQPIQGT